MSQQTKLFIGNLPFSVDEGQLNELFAPFGSIESVAIPKDRETGRARGFAFVNYESAGSAQEALQLDGHEVDGRKIAVKIAVDKPRSGGGSRGGQERRERQY